MAKYSCSNCGSLQEAGEDAFGASIICQACGYLIQLKEESAVKETQARTDETLPAPKKATRGIMVLSAMYGTFILFLPISYLNSQTSTPLCLLAFAVNLILGTGAGFFFLSGMNDPDYLIEWLHMQFTRLTATLFFVPLFVLAYLVAYFTYSP